MKDWKTTAMGGLTIAGVLIAAALNLLHGQPVNVPVLITGLTTGVGLIKASDSKPTN
jgi:hypothetical protein